MASRLFSRLITVVLLACSLLGLILFFGALFAIELSANEGKARSNVAASIYRRAAELDDRVLILARDPDTVLSYAVPAIWIGILTAFFLALVYSILRGEQGKAAG